jgi:hypothetical protein
MAKGGYLNAGGNGTLWGGGRGGYVGGAISGYLMPDLALTAMVTTDDMTTGRGCAVCGRGDISSTPYGAEVEFLFAELYGVSGFASFTASRLEFVDHEPGGFRTQNNTWMVGLRWYPGVGTLIDHHRNGTLNPWLGGTGESLSGFAYGSFLTNGR